MRGERLGHGHREEDDVFKGGKLVAFVLKMVDQSELAFSSISNYLWAMCKWQNLQRRPDPRMGVINFPAFMDAVKVLTWVPGEPRRAIPL